MDGAGTDPRGCDVNAMRMVTTAPLRDLLIAMAEDAIEQRRPDPAKHCRDCRAVVEDRCGGCARDDALAEEYGVLLDTLRDAGTDSEVTVLLERHAVLLAAETGTERAA